MEARRFLPSVTFAPAPVGLVPGIALARGHLLGEVEPDHAGPRGSLALQRREIELAVWRMRDHRIRHALVADQGGERARVDAADGDDAARLQPSVEVLRRAIVGRLGDRRPEHAAAHAAGRQAPRLHVFGVGADIADMREGEGDDLPGIRRVGQDLLIAGHRGIEANLADGDAGGARALALDHRAVGQNEKRGRRLDRPIGRRAQHCGLFGQRFTCVVHLLLEARVRRERPVCKFGCQHGHVKGAASVLASSAWRVLTREGFGVNPQIKLFTCENNGLSWQIRLLARKRSITLGASSSKPWARQQCARPSPPP